MTPVQFHSLSHLPGGVPLGEPDIHLWRARLDVPRERLEHLERSLTPGERERIASLRSDSDRRRATASRGLLRLVLSGYAGRPVAALRFDYGRAGKPALRAASLDEPVHFNTTHSGDLMLVAVGRPSSLGIDVERIRPIARAERVAARAYSEGERRRIEDLPPEVRIEAFVTCWTRKEACVKALGLGVWSAFSRFEVSVEPGSPARLLAVDGIASGAEDWSLVHLDPAPGFVGALAVRGRGWRFSAGTLDSSEAET